MWILHHLIDKKIVSKNWKWFLQSEYSVERLEIYNCPNGI